MNLIRIAESNDFIVDYDKDRGMYRVSVFEDFHFQDEFWFDAYEDTEVVRHGRWIDKGYITTAYGSIDTGCCSVCGVVDVPIEPYDDYCPNCGAKMDGDEQNGKA